MTGEGRPRRSWTGARTSRAAITLALAAALVAACAGATTPVPSGVPISTPLPGASGSPGTTPGGPKPTTWPTNVIAGSIALAASNDSFQTMSSDLAAAVNAQDPKQILDVMTNALAFLKASESNVRYLQQYGATKPVGDQLEAAYQQMITGGQQVVDGLTAGDGKAVQAGFTVWFAGSNAYAAALPALGDLAAQATLMQKNYLQ